MSDFFVNKKDKIRLNFLKEIFDKSVTLNLYLEVNGKEEGFQNIRKSDTGEYRFNNFTITENEEANNITFCHNVIGCLLYFVITTGKALSIDIIKKDSDVVEQTINILPGSCRVIFYPFQNKGYEVGIENFDKLNTGLKQEESNISLPGFDSLTSLEGLNESVVEVNNVEPDNVEGLSRQVESTRQEIEDINEQIEVLNKQLKQLENNRKNLKKHLEKLKAEYDKNYKEFEEEASTLAENYHIDAGLLKMYQDKEIVPAEDLIKKAGEDITELENQIRLFVAAQERKISDIENKIKV